MADRFKHPPIKRHASLVPFSRDHRDVLHCANGLIDATGRDESGQRQAAEKFLSLWSRFYASHIDEEERMLAPLIESADAMRQMRDDHRVLRTLASDLQRSINQDRVTASQLHRLGAAMVNHVRWEERELFNSIQDGASDQQLSRLGQLTHTLEAGRCRTGA